MRGHKKFGKGMLELEIGTRIEICGDSDSSQRPSANVDVKNSQIVKYCIKEINTWAVHLVRYSGPLLKWNRIELQQMDQRTRKLMTTHKAYIPEKT